ncbi:hypothetical protein [Pseudomonas vancouverensis]|uniref:hypothetical protein n=1 Tax=Pseudomonas vancouverensis TaxID=95300 RepID=UPI000879663C|nr:hypothetical protein [Pseudomonas vancouverensis]SDU92342.1 hypothetical protein SAMN05216558_0738 [Pseudomonas vancouverensis]
MDTVRMRQSMLSTSTPSVRSNVYSFLIVFISLFTAHHFFGITDFPYDSKLYWSLSTPEAIANFPDNVRGYVYAYLLLPIHFLTDAVSDSGQFIFRLSSSLLYAYLLTGPVASFFRQCFGGSLTTIRRTVFALLTVSVFPGLFLYPLSDMPAAICLIIAIKLALNPERKHWLVLLFFSGAAASAAYNIRTIYLFAFIALLFTIPFTLHEKSWRARGLGLMIFIFGAFLIALPQMAINKRIHNIASPLVFATVEGKSLMATQLFWGITVQRYETYVGKDTPAPSIYYRDPAGIILRSLNESVFTSEPSISGYASLLMSHPMQFLGIYGRHFVNGIDVRDGLVYITKPSINKSTTAILCFSLFFFGALIFCTRQNPRQVEIVYLAPLLIPLLAILPGAIETRFFLPLYLILFGAIATQFQWHDFQKLLRNHWIPLLAAYIVLGTSFLAITTTTMANVSYSLP